MRVVFFGSGRFGTPTLQRLTAEHTLAAVVTQPDKPAGRGRALTPTPVAAWTREHAAQSAVFKPESVNEPATAEAVRAVDADAWVVIAFGQKMSPALLAERFAINLHASLLPRWRGAAPINHAILAGDQETGNSVITIADRMDAGLILGQSRRTIGPRMTAGELHDALAEDGPDLVMRVLKQHEGGTLRPVEQDESAVTHARKLSKADGWVEFGRPADECRARINGLSPWPSVAVTIGGERVALLCAETAEGGAEEEPGTIVDAGEGLVACGESTRLRLLEVRPAGRTSMSWSTFARGRSLPAGARVDSGAPSC